MCYLSATNGRLVTREDLNEIYRIVGTKLILEGLEKAVQNNYSIE